MWTPTQKGIVFMYRINFGLNSILAELGASGDWQMQTRQWCSLERPKMIDEFIESLSESSAILRADNKSKIEAQEEHIPQPA